jgi:hypothetical protein
MQRNRPGLEPTRRFFPSTLLLLLMGCLGAEAQTVILHLKNGDRLAGTITSEDTNRVVITTSWIKELAVPVTEIARRETPPAPAAPIVEQKSPAPAPVKEVIPSAAPGTPVAIATPAPKPQTPKKKYWKAEAKLGVDFLRGAKDQQIYYGRFKLLYERPYDNSPKQFFRNIFDYGADYGRTEGITSANRMDGSDKTDLDIGEHKLFVYNLAGVGYDKIRKIDLRWELGPGLGYHLLTRSNLVLNTEFGINYQAQYRAGTNATTEKFYYRFGEDLTWKLTKSFTFTEKFEFFPQVEDVGEFRARFEATLSYGFWQNLSLNLTVLDLYDSSPANAVPRNDLQIRSSLGITF